MIDTHCHIDLYKDPLKIAQECEKLNVVTIGVTNLPSHFEMGLPHIKNFKRVRLALGLHPLIAHEHSKELELFLRYCHKTSYIGEVGLDYSKEGVSTREIQRTSFEKILKMLSGQKKVFSIHSRKAEKDVLDLLVKYNVKTAIFHWYSGPLTLIDEILKKGYYFSINPAMIKSSNGKKIIERIPLSKVLTESDGPFISINNHQVRPWDLTDVIDYIAQIHTMNRADAERQIDLNFKNLISSIN